MPTAVITGTNRGLGLEFVRRYLEAGWRVFALNRNESAALTALSTNPALTVLRGDLTDEADLQSMANALRDESVDLLINNAGIMGASAFRVDDKAKQGLYDFDRTEWRAVMEINLLTPAQLIALLRPCLAPDAKLVTISSSMGSIADNSFGGWYAYRASKAAVNSLMKSVSLELGDAVIAVALHPGWVRTDMGGASADIDAATSIDGMIKVIDELTPEHSGGFFSFEGARLNY
jgi:NAD(P)-dependent dehydrogenase (short-subunit alcohol dehydrogenase family)